MAKSKQRARPTRATKPARAVAKPKAKAKAQAAARPTARAKAKAVARPKSSAKAKAADKREAASKPNARAWLRTLERQVEALRSRDKTPEAVALLRRYADAGDRVAQRLLGDLYFRDLPSDHVQALRWYRAAALLGDDDAAENVAFLLRSGDGVADIEAADRFLDEMAAAGRAWAKEERAAIAAERDKSALRAARIALSDEAKLAELAARFDLGHRLDDLRRAARPSVLLLGRPDEEARLGASRIGGEPDLPAGFAWPRSARGPLAFLAQLDLVSLQALVPERALPETGSLSFFYDLDNQPWGGAESRDAWAVRYTPAEITLLRQAAPTGATRLAPFSLAAERELTLPPLRSVAFRELGFSDDEAERYRALHAAYLDEYCRQPAPRGDVHRFLGHPDALQGDMSRRLTYASHGADLDAEDPALEAEARRFRFLFQVGSDFNQDLCWGDNGRLFFWIRMEDLEALRFEATELALQCH